jgi:hypothetical protein
MLYEQPVRGGGGVESLWSHRGGEQEVLEVARYWASWRAVIAATRWIVGR